MAFGVDLDAAAEMAVSDPGTTPEPNPTPEPQVQQQEVQQADPEPQVETTPEDSSQDYDLGVDPNSLSPENKAIYRQMQAGLTKKFEEAKVLREATQQLTAAGITDPATVARYAQLAYRLDNDPSFAAQVRDHLNAQLGGPTPTADNQPGVNDDDGYDDNDELSPAVQNMLQQYEQRLAETEKQVQETDLALRLAREEDSIRALHPDYDEDDWQSVWTYAHATGGDLLKANELYIADAARWATKFQRGKLNVPSGQQPIPSPTPQATEPVEEVKTFKDAREIAMARIAAMSEL